MGFFLMLLYSFFVGFCLAQKRPLIDGVLTGPVGLTDRVPLDNAYEKRCIKQKEPIRPQ